VESRKTQCVLCANACGLNVTIEDNKIVKARGDKDDPRSEGYTCRKALQIRYHQHHADRLLYPLKKVGDGFQRISWEQASAEIAEKLKSTVTKHGPRSLALMGGGTINCIAQGSFAAGMLRGLGSQYRYNALAQELTGRFWTDGETYGDQNIRASADTEHSDMVLIIGKNPMMSHHSDRARIKWKKFSKDPDKVLVVVDPRRTETAKLADIHLAIRPGTDALLLRAMTAIVLAQGWQDQAFIDEHVSGFEEIRSLFEDFDAEAAVKVCELDFDEVKEVCRLFTTKKSCHISDLGVLMSRHSTLVSYLENTFLAVTGRLTRKGGNLLPRGFGARRGKVASEKPEPWRTVATDFPQITGIYPPNVIPEEILNDHPDRLRAVVVSASNPLRSFADTTAYEEAFGELDLLVTIDIAMTETAQLSHYVLPAPSAYEKWDGGGMMLRAPVLEPEGEQLEEGEIFTRLADDLGLIPDIPDSLFEAAESGDRQKYNLALTEYFEQKPEAARRIPFILAKTLGKQLGSAHLASSWGRLRGLPDEAREEVFQAILDQSGGPQLDGAGPDTDEFPDLPTEDGRIRLNVPEMTKWLPEIDPVLEEKLLLKDREEFPLIISSGRHYDYNANTLMRDPEWNKGKRVGTLIMHPIDAEEHQLVDKQMIKVITKGGEEVVELEIDPTTRKGYTMIPQGFGLVHQGEKSGANANRIAKNTHRDPIAGTPLHRYIPCRVQAYVPDGEA
jgi:anaerobic selenocysteine-containing dehydrogenase|tara:strand:+ start:77 stop:2266 length:2190 start_codon:yes stop_codon:yes gene_type:complete